LEVTDVRVERLREISADDIKAEGLPSGHWDEFSDLWDQLNEKRGFGWDTNPFVWVVSFKRIQVQ